MEYQALSFILGNSQTIVAICGINLGMDDFFMPLPLSNYAFQIKINNR